jgi:hypothetical protein
MDNTGCCIPCMEACVLGCCCWELHRTRKDLRTRLGIKGVWSAPRPRPRSRLHLHFAQPAHCTPGRFIDLCLVCLCPCLTTCQETR